MITMVSSNTSDIESLGRERRGKELKKLWTAVGNNSMLLGLTLFATTLLCVTTAFSQATFSSTSIGEIWHISFTWTLAALRVLQAVTTSTTTYTLSLAFESIQWTLVEKKPCSLFTALMLTESTGFMGLLQLGFNRASTWDQRVWPCIRYILSCHIRCFSILIQLSDLCFCSSFHLLALRYSVSCSELCRRVARF
jgi:hypothetical protein